MSKKPKKKPRKPAKKKRPSAAEQLAERRRKHQIQHDRWKAMDSDKGVRELVAGMMSQGWTISEGVVEQDGRDYVQISAKHPEQADLHVARVERSAYVACYQTRRAAWSQLFDASYAFHKTGPGAMTPPEPSDLLNEFLATLDDDEIDQIIGD